MKNKQLACIFILIGTLVSCQINAPNNQSNSDNKIENSSNEDVENENTSHDRDASYYKEKGYQLFSEFGFAIKVPSQLKDISKQAQGDFTLNYAVAVNEDNPNETAFYQLIMIKLPVGYRENPDKIKEKLFNMVENADNYKKIKVGYEGYDGYITEYKHNGYTGKGEMFHKDEYIFGLTVISNDNLEERFNQFTNSLKFFNKKSSKESEGKSTDLLLEAAEAKGFKKGIIENCINNKWSDFKDRPYYNYIKTLNSGMKLYRLELDDMMLEVYVLDNIIKIQSSTILMSDQINKTLREMDAWIMSCSPTSATGDLSIEKIYNFNDFEIMLKNQETGVFYMISSHQ